MRNPASVPIRGISALMRCKRHMQKQRWTYIYGAKHRGGSDRARNKPHASDRERSQSSALYCYSQPTVPATTQLSIATVSRGARGIGTDIRRIAPGGHTTTPHTCTALWPNAELSRAALKSRKVARALV